jgi:hypothetical protein
MWVRYERSKQKHVGGQHILSRIYSQTGIEDDAFLNTNPLSYTHIHTHTHTHKHTHTHTRKHTDQNMGL